MTVGRDGQGAEGKAEEHGKRELNNDRGRRYAGRAWDASMTTKDRQREPNKGKAGRGAWEGRKAELNKNGRRGGMQEGHGT